MMSIGMARTLGGFAAILISATGVIGCLPQISISCEIPEPDCSSAVAQAFEVMGSSRPDGVYRVVPLCSPESCTAHQAARAWVLYPEGITAVEVCPDRSCKAESIPLLPRLNPNN